ncbi:hypothetical protein BGW39_006814 [Mortierella sp. 14UC]|nr:hypothetical protein BGW39_006814 [Mortierella sp. 14UC]
MSTSDAPSCPSFHNVLELVTLLGPFLSPPDLLSSVQVCRLWHTALMCYFWLTIDDSTYFWPRILKNYNSDEAAGGKDENWILGIFAKHGSFIRHLSMQWKVTIKAVFMDGACTNLLSLRTLNLEKDIAAKDNSELAAVKAAERSYAAFAEDANGLLRSLTDILIESDVNPSSYQERTSRDQQRCVLGRIARLNRLRALGVGLEDRVVAFIGPGATIQQEDSRTSTHDTLELNLGAGLGLWSALTRLEAFGFEGLNNSIGERELAWIDSNWPKLTVMHGLQDETIKKSTPDERRVRLRKAMVAIRPEIQHLAAPRTIV